MKEADEITTPANIPHDQEFIVCPPNYMAQMTGVRGACVHHTGTVELEYLDGTREKAVNVLPLRETIPKFFSLIDAVQSKRVQA